MLAQGTGNKIVDALSCRKDFVKYAAGSRRHGFDVDSIVVSRQRFCGAIPLPE
jgi:hypothetical protein